MCSFRHFPVLFLLFAATINSSILTASPWTSTENLRLRMDIQRLNDAGIINIPATTWPILWADVRHGLKGIIRISSKANILQLDPSLQTSLRYVRKQLQENTDVDLNASYRTTYRVFTANTGSLFNGYGRRVEQGEGINITTESQADRFSAGLNLHYLNDPKDQKQWRLDGSYVATSIGNWNVSLSATDRWWGPGWQSSLILSTNARPIPALSFSRMVSYAPESKWLNWIGPWQMTAFMGALENNRVIPNAKLWGMRISFKPFPGLELGLARVAQLGGEGRSESLRSFAKSFLGKGENVANDSGNQLGGLDARYSWQLFSSSAALYGQLIGEDEAGYLPAKYIFLGGMEVSGVATEQGYLSIFIEYSDTLSGRIVGDARPNTAYEHHAYKSGYRYYGRPLGASSDNDARTVTLGGMLIEQSGAIWTAALSQLDLNTDSVARANQVSPTHHKMQHFMLSHKRQILAVMADFSVEWSSELPQTNLVGSDRFGVYAGIEYRM